VGGELDHQPLGQRLDGVVFIVLFGAGGLAADGDDSALSGRGRGSIVAAGFSIGLSVAAVDGDGRLVLRPHIAAIDHDLAVAVHADEDAGARDVGGIVDDGTFLEGFKRLLDLAQALVDLVRQLVGAVILRFEPVVLGAQRLAFVPLFLGEIDEGAADLAQAVVIAVGQVEVDLDPLPAFDGDLVCDRLQLRIPAPTAVLREATFV
jgi:hypothetical protein